MAIYRWDTLEKRGSMVETNQIHRVRQGDPQDQHIHKAWDKTVSVTINAIIVASIIASI